MDAGEDTEASLLQKKNLSGLFLVDPLSQRTGAREHCSPCRVVHFSIQGAEWKEQSGEGPREVRGELCRELGCGERGDG